MWKNKRLRSHYIQTTEDGVNTTGEIASHCTKWRVKSPQRGR